jgi:hypothetical protein
MKRAVVYLNKRRPYMCEKERDGGRPGKCRAVVAVAVAVAVMMMYHVSCIMYEVPNVVGRGVVWAVGPMRR